MKVTSFAILLPCIKIVGAFAPKSPLSDLQRSAGAVNKPLKSSRAEPIPDKQVVSALSPALTKQIATAYKRWGIDNTTPDEYFDEELYWADSRIHTLGNLGILGALHAALAPVSTKMIDNIAYEGVDIRRRVAEELSSKYRKQKAKVLDLCCGVGFSTRALVKAFPDAEKIIGVDTSPQMLAMARYISAHVVHLRPWWKKFTERIKGVKMPDCHSDIIRGEQFMFEKGNAECTSYKDGSFDVVTVMYAFHEVPKRGRQRILQEARRVLSPGGVLAIIDISADYKPSPNMLAGEPYVLEYQKNIHDQLRDQQGFLRAQYKTLVPGHVGMWVLKRSYAV